jgi:hypothetical protein
MHKEQTPRLLSIYASLSDTLYVQILFGILQRSEGQYAVMEDLAGQSDVASVQEALGRDEFTNSSDHGKLELCCDIASAVASFHEIGLVVKVIADSSVFLRFEEDHILPIFTNLESSRRVCLVYSVTKLIVSSSYG